MVRRRMVARIAVILGDVVLDPNTGRVPIMDPEIQGARREAGLGVCAVNIGICGRTRRGRRLAGRRCPRRCHSGPISGLSRRGIVSSMGRRIETQARAINQLRRRVALCTCRIIHDLSAGRSCGPNTCIPIKRGIVYSVSTRRPRLPNTDLRLLFFRKISSLSACLS